MELAVSVHFLKNGLVLRPEIEPHFEEEGYLHFSGVSVLNGQLVDGADGHRDDSHVGVEDLEGVELEMEGGGPPLEVVPVVFGDGEVNEFLRGWEVSRVVDGFFLIDFIPGERDGGGLDFDLSKVFDNVIEDF